MAKTKLKAEDVEKMPRPELTKLAREMGIEVKPGTRDLEGLRKQVVAKLAPPAAAPKKGKAPIKVTAVEGTEAEDLGELPHHGGTPPVTKKKNVTDKEIPAGTAVALAGDDGIKPVDTSTRYATPPWAEDLIRSWARVEAKLDKVLAAIEVEEQQAAPAPKERTDAPAPRRRLPAPPEASLEEQGFVGVTVDEIKLMDREALVELARAIGVDVSDCIRSQRVMQKRIIAYVSKGGEVFEAQKVAEAKAAPREKVETDLELAALVKAYKKVGFSGPCGVACGQCPHLALCHQYFYSTGVYEQPESEWGKMGIPDDLSPFQMWEQEAAQPGSITGAVDKLLAN